LGGLAIVVVIALAVVITVLVMRPSGGGGATPTPTNGNSDFASANDTGPVNIIAEDPTCAAWGKVASEFADVQKSVAWADRDLSMPAGDWTSAQRNMYDVTGRLTTINYGNSSASIQGTDQHWCEARLRVFPVYRSIMRSYYSAF